MVRLTDRPDMTLDVYRRRKTIIQQQLDIQYGSITLYKGKISYKIFSWKQASLLLKELMIFISNL